MLLHGGWGYSEEDPIARFTVDALVLPIFEGVKPILELKVIARQLLSGGKSIITLMRNTDWRLLAGDCAAFLLFGLIGLTSHEESVTVQIVVRSLLVFPVAWLLVAPWFARLRSEWPKARGRASAGRVARGGDDRPVGRSLIFDRELLNAFFVIALVGNGLFLVGWRAIYIK